MSTGILLTFHVSVRLSVYVYVYVGTCVCMYTYPILTNIYFLYLFFITVLNLIRNGS